MYYKYVNYNLAKYPFTPLNNTLALHDKLFYIFSQVTPAPNNRAANSLSHDIQQRNIRSVKVNARVTMMTWMMECVANLFFMVIFFALSRKILFWTINMLFYYVIIPYAFLMNTSHNKDRIIDEGLEAVILNVLGKSNLRFACLPSFEQLLRSHGIITDAEYLDDQNVRHQESESTKSVHNRRQCWSSTPADEIKISSIATKQIGKQSNEDTGKLEIIDLEDGPNTSKIKFKPF